MTEQEEFVWAIRPVDADPFVVEHVEIKGWGVEVKEEQRIPFAPGREGERTLYPWESLLSVARRRRDRLEELEEEGRGQGWGLGLEPAGTPGEEAK